MPNELTNISAYSFFGCTNLDSVIIPKSVTIIGRSAFGYCKLENLVIPDDGSISRLEYESFKGCDFTSFNIIGSIETISDSVFANCDSLIDIFLPDTIINLGRWVFLSCDNLETVYCEPADRPLGWDGAWNSNSSSSISATIIWGATK